MDAQGPVSSMSPPHFCSHSETIPPEVNTFATVPHLSDRKLLKTLERSIGSQKQTTSSSVPRRWTSSPVSSVMKLRCGSNSRHRECIKTASGTPSSPSVLDFPYRAL